MNQKQCKSNIVFNFINKKLNNIYFKFKYIDISVLDMIFFCQYIYLKKNKFNFASMSL